MAVNAYGQYTISAVDDGVGIKSKQDYYTLSNQKDSLDGAKSYFEKEASGTIASFSDGAEDAPMGVVVDIDPVQDLHGYDSPWPAGGGKNMCGELEQGGFNTSGLNASGTTRIRTKAYFPVVAGQTYVASFNATTAGRTPQYSISYYTADDYVTPRIGYSQFANSGVPTTAPEGATFGRATFKYTNEGDVTINSFSSVQIEIGSTPTAYAPYSNICPISGWTKATISHSGADTSNPTEYEIPFSTEVYGGTLNVETGELVVDREIVDLTTGMSGGTAGGNYVFFKQLQNALTVPNSQIADIIAEAYIPIRFNAIASSFYHIALRDNGVIYVNTGYADVQPVGNAVFKLATPITLTLTPTEIRSLLGDNNAWADTGDVDVKYINEQDLTWETEPLVPNEEGKYLWWKYKITKDDDSTWESDPAVIGMFSDSDRVLANIEKAQNTADFAQGAAQMAQSSANYAQDAADRAQQSANNAQDAADRANDGVENLRNDVASNYVTIADFSVSNESIQSSVTEVRTIAEAAQLSADTNYSDLSGNLEDLEGRVSTNETSISSIVTATSNLEQRADSINLTVSEHTREIEELQGYTTGLKATMNLTASGLDISGGDTTSDTHVHINGDGVSITDGTNTPAYFHGQESKMINVEITEILRIGNHKLLARSGGTNTTVVYVGDE